MLVITNSILLQTVVMFKLFFFCIPFQPPIVILNLVVVEASGLEAKDADGTFVYSPGVSAACLISVSRMLYLNVVTSGARSAERVLLWFKGEISVCAARPDPTP